MVATQAMSVSYSTIGVILAKIAVSVEQFIFLYPLLTGFVYSVAYFDIVLQTVMDSCKFVSASK